MSIGSRRHHVTIKQKNVTGRNARNEDIYTWGKFADAWMEVRGLTGRETFQYGQMWPNAQLMLRSHYIAGITTEMRIYDNCCNRIFDIRAATDREGRKIELYLLCEEIQA